MRNLVFLLLVACGGSEAPVETPVEVERAAEPAAPEASADAEGAALAAAKEGAKALGGTLKAKVIEGLAANGPAATLEMCSQEAQGLTAMVAGEHQIKVGRTSDKLRNPNNAGPEWAQAWFASVRDTPVAEVKPMTEVVEIDGKKVARFAAPIGIAEPCLLCHGSPGDDVKAKLSELYPEDKATGYELGQLRGAIWAEADVKSGS
ncbi:MAG: DUF3365 domain-containing protein [Deltaproteobacteria bacterium]|nr:MAG: DUF3365 domain-containing protein [Deltaproteobacteria bacterium]